ncbi:unknown [Sutterella sp. CAG:397]|nr:unknown [Sutterella sp. CAG:397]
MGSSPATLAARLAVPAVGAKVMPAEVPITEAAAAGEVPTAFKIGKSATRSSIARPAADGITVTSN